MRFFSCITGHHRKKTGSTKECVDPSKSTSNNQVTEPSQQYQSAPSAQRSSYLVKRPTPYTKANSLSLRRPGGHQRHILAPKHVVTAQSAFDKEQLISDIKPNTGSVFNQNMDETFNAAADAVAGNQINQEDVNDPGETGTFPELNPSHGETTLTVDTENTNIKAEPSETENDLNDADNIRHESVSDSIYSSQWETTGSMEQGETAFSASSQDYGKSFLVSVCFTAKVQSRKRTL